MVAEQSEGWTVLVVDNYDSFTFNLVQYLGELGCRLVVRRNDKLSVEEIERLAPDWIVISPGPGTPSQAGLTERVIAAFSSSIPILGICLGHQAIAEVFGGEVVRAPQLMHGKTSLIRHGGSELFKGVDSPFQATRYHSLIVRRDNLPAALELTAETDDGLVMGLKVREHSVFGVQFHPESIMTPQGMRILENFLCCVN
jgi:anthranilate synthase/aminodeoxychorismate synthase-like glutamine amidotransferase